jgi:hypothetical protein
VAYLQLALMFALTVFGGALGASTDYAPNILWGSLPGLLGLCGLIWIHRPQPATADDALPSALNADKPHRQSAPSQRS